MIQWIKTRLGLQKPRLRIKNAVGVWHACVWLPSGYDGKRLTHWHWEWLSCPKTGGAFGSKPDALTAGLETLDATITRCQNTLDLYGPKGWIEIHQTGEGLTARTDHSSREHIPEKRSLH